MEVIKCGTIVLPKLNNKKEAMITACVIRFDNIQYELTWFDNNKYETQWVNENEFRVKNPKVITIKVGYIKD